jgi:hypothetical protein
MRFYEIPHVITVTAINTRLIFTSYLDQVSIIIYIFMAVNIHCTIPLEYARPAKYALRYLEVIFVEV